MDTEITGVLMDRAAQKRALRAAGYRGSKSTRNRLGKAEAEQAIGVTRYVVNEQLRQASAAHFAIQSGIVRRKKVCSQDGEPWPCAARQELDKIPGV